MRQFADETDRIGEQERQILDRHFSNGSIEGSKEFILREHIGLGEQIHEGGLTDIGITDERDAYHLSAMLALGCHLFINRFELLTQEGDTLPDDPFIRLNLGLTHTAIGTTTASLAVKVGPHTCQTRQHILQMRHLDLGLSVRGLRALKEDLEDKNSAIDDTDVREAFVIKRFLDITYLPRGEFVVEDYDVYGMMLPYILVDFIEFSFAHIGSRNRKIQSLGEPFDGNDTMCVGQKSQLIQVFFSAFFRLIRSYQSHQYCVLYVRLNFYHTSLRVQRYTKKMIYTKKIALMSDFLLFS